VRQVVVQFQGVFRAVFDPVSGYPSTGFEQVDLAANRGSVEFGFGSNQVERRPAKPVLVCGIRQSQQNELGLWIFDSRFPSGVQVADAHGAYGVKK
jgi:hypothetical protein